MDQTRTSWQASDEELVAHTTGTPVFVVDAMLGSLARKLRIHGFDAEYFKRGSDQSMITRARRGGRVILTADRGLCELARRRGTSCLLVTGRTDRERIGTLVLEARRASTRLQAGDSRCALCNRVLVPVEKEMLVGRVPETILRRHRLFYKCGSCEKAYWRGKHWDRLRRILKELDKKKDLIRDPGRHPKCRSQTNRAAKP